MAETSLDDLRQQVDLIFRHVFPNGPPPTFQPTVSHPGAAQPPQNSAPVMTANSSAAAPDQGTLDDWGRHRPMPGYLPPAVQVAQNNTGAPANPPLPVSMDPGSSSLCLYIQDYCSREAYVERLTLVENFARWVQSGDMVKLKLYLEATSATLSLHHRAMMKFRRGGFRQLRRRLEASHPLSYRNFKVIMETDMEDNVDICARIGRLVTRLERREQNGLMAAVAIPIAKELYVQAILNLRKTDYFTTEESEWLEVAQSIPQFM